MLFLQVLQQVLAMRQCDVDGEKGQTFAYVLPTTSAAEDTWLSSHTTPSICVSDAATSIPSESNTTEC